MPDTVPLKKSVEKIDRTIKKSSLSILDEESNRASKFDLHYRLGEGFSIQRFIQLLLSRSIHGFI